MRYENIVPASFIARPNRFIARVSVNGEEKTAHVKNTGRCRELLVPDAEIWLQRFDSSARKTEYDLITVKKGERLINIDSQAPNKVFHEWVAAGKFIDGLTLIRPETVHGDSRFDFYMEAENRRIFAEIKGVTLETDGIALFPDAPTERGVKHIRELIECVREGYECYAVFIIQMPDIKYFTPNSATHPEFAKVLADAAAQGVNIRAYCCGIEPDSIAITDPVDIIL